MLQLKRHNIYTITTVSLVTKWPTQKMVSMMLDYMQTIYNMLNIGQLSCSEGRQFFVVFISITIQ